MHCNDWLRQTRLLYLLYFSYFFGKKKSEGLMHDKYDKSIRAFLVDQWEVDP